MNEDYRHQYNQAPPMHGQPNYPPQGPPPPQQYHMPPQQHHQPQYGQPYNHQMPQGAPQGPPQTNVVMDGRRMIIPGVKPTGHDPLPLSRIEGGRKYELIVVQQPRRARMCGFGDKDRRPITPPPCVRLIITDAVTGKEIDCNEIDHSMFVLNADLWSTSGKDEVNLVRHAVQSPSISHTTSHSYAETRPVFASIQPQHLPHPGGRGQGYNPFPQNGPPNVTSYPHGPPPHQAQYQQQAYPPPGHQYAQHPYQGPPPGAYPPGAVTGAQIHAQGNPGPQPPTPYEAPESQQGRGSQSQPQGMFTRNLIGSLAVSAFRLTDTEDRIGIWFVLQDLSIRTEGHFRLRFSFVNLANIGVPTLSTPGPHTNPSGINTGKAPVLAACFSEVFTVYSAKKFPGVVESTPLSKCFATQGIKIPIRKEGDNKKKADADPDDED